MIRTVENILPGMSGQRGVHIGPYGAGDGVYGLVQDVRLTCIGGAVRKAISPDTGLCRDKGEVYRSVGLLSKRFTEAIESLDFRAYHALESMGVPLLLRIRYAVLPQLLPALASAVLYRFDVNIREASVLGLVGAGGIGAPLIFAMNHYKWSEAGAIALGLILLVWCIDRLSASLRR